MKSFILMSIRNTIVGLALAALVLTPALVVGASASDSEEEYITLLGVLAAEGAYERGPEQALALGELYATSLDEEASPACRAYAEVLLLTTTMLNATMEYPESEVVEAVWEVYLDYVPTARFDCEVAS